MSFSLPCIVGVLEYYNVEYFYSEKNLEIMVSHEEWNVYENSEWYLVKIGTNVPRMSRKSPVSVIRHQILLVWVGGNKRLTTELYNDLGDFHETSIMLIIIYKPAEISPLLKFWVVHSSLFCSTWIYRSSIERLCQRIRWLLRVYIHCGSFYRLHPLFLP